MDNIQCKTCPAKVPEQAIGRNGRCVSCRSKMTYCQRKAQEWGMEKGAWLYLLEYSLENKKFRQLYLYETARSFDEDRPKNRGIEYKLDRVQWDGVEDFSFYNGD